MFVTFEGIDGSGKTTQIGMLSEYLKSKGVGVFTTKEPGGGGQFSMDMRRALSMSDTLLKSELLAIFAARNEHIQKEILPALSDGKVVLCDRYIDSSIAYYCEGMDDSEYFEARKEVDFLQKMVGGLMPDLTFFLDIKLEESVKRSNKRECKDKYDKFGLDRKQRIQGVYYRLAGESSRIKTIDANKGVDEVFNEIKNAFDYFNF